MDANSEIRLGLVCPALANKIRTLAETLAGESIHLRATQGVRSWSQQEATYQQGRTTPGPIVTNAPPGHSWHEFGLAVDVAPFDAQDVVDWNVSHPAWRRIIEIGESLGLFSGDEFCHFKDDPHFQLTGRFPVSPTDEARQLLTDKGMEAVWTEAGL